MRKNAKGQNRKEKKKKEKKKTPRGNEMSYERKEWNKYSTFWAKVNNQETKIKDEDDGKKWKWPKYKEKKNPRAMTCPMRENNELSIQLFWRSKQPRDKNKGGRRWEKMKVIQIQEKKTPRAMTCPLRERNELSIQLFWLKYATRKKKLKNYEDDGKKWTLCKYKKKG
jgi:hypothetical protein